jgi:hypothetical protein
MYRAQRFFSSRARSRNGKLRPQLLQQQVTTDISQLMKVSIGEEVSDIESKNDLIEVFKKIDATVVIFSFSKIRTAFISNKVMAE